VSDQALQAVIDALMQVNLQREVIFIRKLKAFAAKRGISTSESNWEQKAINAAAREHPELNPAKRGRGRPKEKIDGIEINEYSILKKSDRKKLELLHDIERIQIFAQEKRNHPNLSQKNAVEIYLILTGKEKDTKSNNFQANTRTLETRISEAKRLRKSGIDLPESLKNHGFFCVISVRSTTD
jgi:superfamily II DNA or RNA helicase